MASTALEVVSLAEVKSSIRMPSGERSLDGMLSSQIASAVSWVQRQTYLPLVDSEETFAVPWVFRDRPVVLSEAFIRSINAVHYWSPTGAERADPDGAVDVETLGRIEVLPADRGICVYPPPAGWPDLLPGSAMRWTCTRGFPLTAESAALRDVVIAGVRQLYTGAREIRADAAMEALLGPWRYYGLGRRGGVRTAQTVTRGPNTGGGPTPHHGAHARRVGWSVAGPGDAHFDAAAALTGGASFTTDRLVVPAFSQPGAYLLIGVPVDPGRPDSLRYEGSDRNQIDTFRVAGAVPNVLIDGEEEVVLVSNAQLNTQATAGLGITLGYSDG